ncbi:MATE family efflux transporter [Bacteroides pyogenes]|uniref:polysaccharide biosynthesis protein n=1 Tax=Bacteroides pyogenes TaxID=310300 RepID=UPI001F368B74|nr:polysaccharide biosynthesis protein [Bacteroides pyogenes]MCE9107067.1 polysaccharide biosynthesis protein [Bacteroides pyogenes]
MQRSNSKRIAKNTTLLYVRMLFIMLINVFSVRFVLKGLGVVDYGVFNVVASFVTMFSGLSSIISSATLRFHSYSIGKGKEEKVSDVFTASFNISASLCLAILIIGEIIGIWFINSKMVIPADRLAAANWVYQLSVLTFIVLLLTSPFTAVIFAYEKMQLFSVISIVECVFKFLLAISLLYISFDHLIFYGVGLLLIAIAHFLVYFIFIAKSGKIKYKKHVEKSLYKQMLAFSGWTLFSSSASIGMSQLVTMITNVFFGPIVNAARAIAFQLSTAINSFTNNIVLAIKPPIIKYYAEGDYDRVNRYFSFANKAIFFSMTLILLPIFFEMEIVLKLWLDVNDAQTILFSRLIVIYVFILALNNPIAIVVQATGHIRAYSTYVEVPTLLCFPLTWLMYWLGFPAESAFYIMIVAIMFSHIIRLVCLKRLFTTFSYREYIINFMLPAFLVLLLSSFILIAVNRIMIVGYARLFISLAIAFLAVGIISLSIGFNKSERKTLFAIFKINA